MAFLLEQILLIACYAFRECIRSLVGGVERHSRDGVHTGYSSGECLSLAAQQVHVGIVNCLVELRCRCVCHHFACVVSGGVVLLHNLCPKHAGGTEFGNLHEEVAADTHVELDAVGDCVDCNTCIGERGEPCCTPGYCITKFLIYV